MADGGRRPVLDRAMEVVKTAIEADRAGNYADALSLYQRALEMFMVALKHEKISTVRDVLVQRMDEYMARAETLKAAVAASRGHGGPGRTAEPAGGAGGGAGGGSGGDHAGSTSTPELDKLKEQLSGIIMVERPSLTFDDVAGLDGAKRALHEAIIMPRKFPSKFRGRRTPWKGVLMYGPPGTGKSHLAKAVASTADATFINVGASDLVSKWQGESAKLVRALFEIARERAPSVVFIDEVDALVSERSDSDGAGITQIKNEFLVRMDGVQSGGDGEAQVLVLGATNKPWVLDIAVRRRFEKRVYIPLPDAPTRARLFEVSLGEEPHTISREEFRRLGERSEGLSGADVAIVVREALMQPMRRASEAKFFRRNPRTGLYEAVARDPPCPRCTPDLTFAPAPERTPCAACGAERRGMFTLTDEELHVPDVSLVDFMEVIEHATPSVGRDELGRYEEWTAMYGRDGSV